MKPFVLVCFDYNKLEFNAFLLACLIAVVDINIHINIHINIYIRYQNYV